MKQFEEKIRKLRNISKDHENYQQVVVKVRKLENIIEEQDCKIKMIKGTDHNQKNVGNLRGKGKNVEEQIINECRDF